MTIEEWLAYQDDDSSEILNCGILHFSRVTGSGELAEKFARVRLVDPEHPARAVWRAIDRPRFTNRDLFDQVESYEHLWDGNYA